MADPGWGIWDCSPPPPPPPPPPLVEEPCSHTLLIKLLNFARPRSVYKSHENMHFSTNSPQTEVKQAVKSIPSTFVRNKRI